jgi:hypothetical protein
MILPNGILVIYIHFHTVKPCIYVKHKVNIANILLQIKNHLFQANYLIAIFFLKMSN